MSEERTEAGEDQGPEAAGPGDGAPNDQGPEVHPGAAAGRSLGQEVLHPTRETYLDVVSALRDRGYEMCADLCAVDYLAHPGRALPPGIGPERFEVVVNLVSLSRCRRVRVRVQVPESDPRIMSLYGLYPGTEPMEREAYDMMGIVFDGHPDLNRILMPEDWEGYPLRKDYPVGRVPVQFKGAPSTR